jgi:hypothetical protein
LVILGFCCAISVVPLDLHRESLIQDRSGAIPRQQPVFRV